MYLYKMTATLHDIVKYNLIKVGDSIEFNFKQHYFRAKIIRGGLITDCTVYRPQATKSEKILENVTSFSSLTGWTEACLQEFLEEYFTRYSSWKRVYHVESRQSMGEIRDRCKLMNGRVKNEDISELYKELFRLQKIIQEMSTVLKSKNAYEKRWALAQFIHAPEDEKVLKVKKRRIKYRKAFNNTQTLMMSSF